MTMLLRRSQCATILDALEDAITSREADLENDLDCGGTDTAREHRTIIARYKQLRGRTSHALAVHPDPSQTPPATSA
jgi:hypothetical protein